MLIACPHCNSSLKIDEKIVATTGGGPCPACGRLLAIKVPSMAPEPMPTPIQRLASVGPSAEPLGRQGVLIAGGLASCVVIVVAGLFMTAAGAGRVASAPQPLPAPNPGGQPWDQDLDEKKRELRELSKEYNKIEAEAAKLKQERDSLEHELKDLTSRREAINKFKRTSLMLVNPHSLAVGIQDLPDGGFKVVQKAEGPFQQDAVRWARKAGHPTFGQEPELTRQLFETVELNELVPAPLAQEIRRHWSQPHFVPYPREDPDPPFVSVQEAETGRRVLGFYLDHNRAQIRFRGVAPTNDVIPRSRIQTGSARLARGEKILSSLTYPDFLDYCVLKIAQSLTTRESKPALIRVALLMEVDALKEAKELSELPDTRPTDELFEFWARLFGHPYPGDRRKEPVRILRELAMYVEDEMYEKLRKLGIPMVERQQIEAVIEESRFGQPLSPTAQGELSQLGATHMVFVDLKKSQQGGTYHLALRLSDVRHGTVLWSQSGERLAPQPDVQQRFLMQTGRLAVVTVKPGFEAQFQGYEEPSVAVPTFLGVKSSREHLVFVEDSVDDQSITYRPLFSSKRESISRKEIEPIKWVAKDRDVDTPHQVRYIVWKLASKILPAGGRVMQVEGDRATITLGLRHGVKRHDTLYVLRELEQPDGEHLTGSPPAHVLLATSLNVTEIDKSSSTVVISGSGLAGWEDDEGLRPNDIVITKPGRPMSIAMLAPGWKEPTQKTIYRMDLKNKVKYQRAVTATLQTSVQLKNAVGDGLRNVGIPVFTTVTQNGILTTGATHVFGGFLQPIDTNYYRGEVMVFPLNAINIGLLRDPKMQIPQLGEQLERVEANINLSTMK